MKFYRKNEKVFEVEDNVVLDLKEELANSKDAAFEKHIPYVVTEGNVVSVCIGEVPHPMQTVHYIEYVILVTNKMNYKKYLKPGDEPKVKFVLDNNERPEEVYAFCNIHGLWVKNLG